MSTPPTSEQLRKDIESCRSDIARIEGQQESAIATRERLLAEAKELNIEPGDLHKEAMRMREDVALVIASAQEEIANMRGSETSAE